MLYSHGNLDYEMSPVHKIEVIAYDLGDPALTSSTELTVNVVDLPDEKPRFEKEVYEAEAKENIAVGEVVVAVSAGRSSFQYSIVGEFKRRKLQE